MSRKKTHEEYVSELAVINPSIEVIDRYMGARIPILHKCLIDGNQWKATPTNTLRGHGCPICAGNIQKTHEQYVNEVHNINPQIDVVETYVNALTPIKHKCKIDGYEWNPFPITILRGGGCPLCGIKSSASLRSKTHEQYVIDCNLINPNIEVIGVYINCETPILHKCKIDNHEWLAKPNNILSGYGCPRCNESHGEKYIRNWLDINNIFYIRGYVFDDCKDKKALPFDFYLPDFNVCIEYDGEQHFKSIDFFGGEDRLRYVQCHDQIKSNYCKNNNIPLLRIKYDENIEEKLNSFIH